MAAKPKPSWDKYIDVVAGIVWNDERNKVLITRRKSGEWSVHQLCTNKSTRVRGGRLRWDTKGHGKSSFGVGSGEEFVCI